MSTATTGQNVRGPYQPTMQRVDQLRRAIVACHTERVRPTYGELGRRVGLSECRIGELLYEYPELQQLRGGAPSRGARQQRLDNLAREYAAWRSIHQSYPADAAVIDGLGRAERALVSALTVEPASHADHAGWRYRVVGEDLYRERIGGRS